MEGVDHRHVPPLALRQRADHLTGIALSAQLEKGSGVGGGERGVSFGWLAHLLAVSHVRSSATHQLLGLDTEELHGLGGVLGHGHREVWIHRGDIQLAVNATGRKRYVYIDPEWFVQSSCIQLNKRRSK